MGVIFRNDIPYGRGGGGDNSKELTYEEYQALSEEEKKNGTTYYVPDAKSTNISSILNTKAEIEANTEENKIAGALAVKELFTYIPKPPTTSTTITKDFTSGNTYTADEDCWVVAATTMTDASQYGLLSIYDEVLPYYQDKEIAYGIYNIVFLVKLYVKKGTSVVVTGAGAIDAITLLKLV